MSDIDARQTHAVMKPILFLLSPAFGHYHATYKLAMQLKERGYQVIYAGESIYREAVVPLGFEFREFSFSNLVRDRYSKLRYFQLDAIRLFFSNLFHDGAPMYEDYASASIQAKEVVASIDPAVILLDIHISSLYLLLAQTGRPCFQICTTLSTGCVSMVPPLTSGFVPKGTAVFGLLTDALWWRHSLQTRLDYLFQKFIYLGKDNDSYLRKFARENGVQPNDFMANKVLKTGKIPVPELIFAPKLFDYPWRTEPSNVSYIGPSVLMERVERFDDATLRLLQTLKDIRMRHGDHRIVYCSLGTINYWQNKNCLDFFRKVIAAFGNRSGWSVVMAIGRDISKDDLGNMPDNINIFSVVPQIKVLSVCDVMITHGGFNTMKECILSAVPMVVYPLSNLWDQEGNAARAVYHKIGLRGDLEKDTPQKVFSTVNALFQDPEFKKNVCAMSRAFEQLNDSTIGVETIDSFIRNGVKLATVL